MAESEPITVVNVCASTQLEHEMDVKRLATDLPIPDARYSDASHAAIVPIDGAKIILYRTGQVFVRGGDSYDRAHDAYHQFLRELHDLGINPQPPELEVQNVVCISTLGAQLDLNALVLMLGLEDAEYEPEQFPAVIYRGDEAVSLIFASGTVNIVGAPSKTVAQREYWQIEEMVCDNPAVTLDHGDTDPHAQSQEGWP